MAVTRLPRREEALRTAVAARDASVCLITCAEFDTVRSDPRLAALRLRVFGDYATGAGEAN
jgi:hypothetical protein